ncbi:hypothetical protein [Parachlamydia sp. AcF125]|uniref:hypothetical protein n=1 Tax=Parachlamydia sp. AcF125 TaxID=2795736 RepID=UPI001BC90F3C|nr:hypothetical protein [Parachlamydia sp. AcF125]MBS4168383.1 hypothetical protein [Parachlamydia sp. AcF125]
MNKKISKEWLFFLVCLCLPIFAQAEMAIKYRTAALFPANSRFSHLYEDVIPNYQFEVSKCICPHVALWANADFFSTHGKASKCGPSKMGSFNLSVGPKWIYPLSCRLEWYIGVGANLAMTHVKNKTPCGGHHKHKTAVGGVFKSGINFYLRPHLFLDMFFDYLYQPVHFHKWVDIGGAKIGGGIGYSF